MMNYGGMMPDLKEKWLQDLAEKVGDRLHTRKQIEIFTHEIERTVNEIENLTSKTAAGGKQLDEINRHIHEIQHRVTDLRGTLTGLETDRRAAERAYETVKTRKGDLGPKLALMPKMQNDINKLLTDVRKSSRKLLSLQTSHGEFLNQKEKLTAEVKSMNTELVRLEEEIKVTKNTREILSGIRPDHFDADVFEQIQGDVDQAIESYVSEMKEEIETIKRGISSLKAQLEEKKTVKDGLLSKKRDILGMIERLRSQMGEDISKEALSAELERLNEERIRLNHGIDEKQMEIRRDKDAAQSLKTRIRQEEELYREISERYSHLESRKQEMDTHRDVGAKILELRDETQKLNLDAAISGVIHVSIEKLTEDTEPVKRKLRAEIESFRELFGEFEREIDGLLSP